MSEVVVARYKFLQGIALFVLLSFFPQISLSQMRQIDPEIQKEIDAYIQEVFLPESGVSGLGLALMQNDGELLYTTGYGMGDIEKEIPNGNQTQFQIASITKTFTAVVAVKLLNERFPEMGETVLDTPIRTLLPEMNFTLGDRFRSEHVTVRDLLAHRVCIFRGDTHSSAGYFETTEDVIYHQRYAEEICGVRSQFQYNNQMYAVVGKIISVVANKSYEDTIQELLNDLGMFDSTFVKINDDFSQIPYRAKPYYIIDNVTYPMNTELFKRVIPENAAGGLFVTPNDMSKYMRFRINFGNLDGKQLVPKNVMAWLTKPSHIIARNLSFKEKDDQDTVKANQIAYGLGIILGTYRGYEYNQHAGGFPPYISLLSFYPAKNLSIFTAVHEGPLEGSQMDLHGAIFDILNGNKGKSKAKHPKIPLQKKENETKAVSDLLKDFLENRKWKITSFSLSTNLAKNVNRTGIYGKGNLGEVFITENFNEKANQTQYYLKYGYWFTGWLVDTGIGNAADDDVLYKFDLDTDAIQDNYAVGLDDDSNYVLFTDNNTILEFLQIYDDQVSSAGTFQKGVRLGELPRIPWNPDSC